MVITAIFGIFLIVVSLFMLIAPHRVARCAVSYCNQWFMHPLEIAICVVSGAAFALFGSNSCFPTPFQWCGYLLLAVGFGLMLTPPSLHRRFGVWSLEKFERFFRPASFLSLVAGVVVVYGSLASFF